MPDVTEQPISAELAAVRAARAQVAARKAAAEKAAAARAQDPAVLLAAEKLELAREQREADLAEHELAADKIYLDACVAQGEDRVARVRTRYGSIVFRAQLAAELEAAETRANAHKAAAKMAKTQAERDMHERNYMTALEMGFADSVLTDRKHFDRVIAQNTGLWKRLWAVRNTLIDASMVDEGKADAH